MFDVERAKRGLPESVFAADAGTRARPLLVTTGYVATIRTAFSGSSWYLAEAGMRAGTLDGIVSAQSEVRPDYGLKARGALWKAGRKLRGQKIGGYKFTTDFQDSIWKRHLPLLAGTSLIDNCQTRGEWFLRHYREHDIRLFNYVDGTLTEYFTTYRDFDCATIDDTTMRQAIEDERRGYAEAEHIVAMCERTRASLRADYDVPDDKISIVVPGANIDDSFADRVLARPEEERMPEEFVLGFIGLFPLRKGLDRLAQAVTILRQRGRRVRLRVIGRCPPEIAAMDGVDDYGIVRKADEPERFVEIVSGVHLGCQLSWAELFGIAMMEFLRFGIPILATDAGGLPDIVAGGGGVLVPREITAEELAERLDAIIGDEAVYRALAQGARKQSQWASWTRASADLAAVLGPRARE